MSDFLTNLLVRSMGSAPVVKPRLPSLFEPSTPYAVSLAESYPAEERAVSEAGPQDIIDRPDTEPGLPERPVSIRKSHTSRTLTQELPPVAKPFPASESSRAHGHRQSDALPVVPAFSEILPFPDILPFPEILREDDVPAPTQAPTSLPSLQPLSYNHPSNNHQPARQAASEGLGYPRHRATPQPQSIMSEIPERVGGNLDEAAPHQSEKSPQPTQWQAKSLPNKTKPEPPPSFAQRASAAAESLKIPRLEFARHVPPAPSITPPEPTIQVTIGRIEVRAVSTPAAAPKQRGPSPVMTLHDYLRSKRGGA